MTSRWILETLNKDIVFFVIPALVALLIAAFLPEFGQTSILYALLATAVIDSGHVYTTAWRTYLNPSESNSFRYIIIPSLILLFFTVSFYFKFNWLWKLVVYSTIFHHIRQVYGISKWYQLLNQRVCKTSDKFLYALAVIPLVVFHFRSNVSAKYYSDEDLYLSPNIEAAEALSLLYLIVVFGWFCHELYLFKKNIREINRFSSIALPSLVYGYCFLIGTSSSQVLFPLLFLHGVAYIGIMGQTVVRTQRTRFNNLLKGILVIAVTAVTFGLSESWIEEYVVPSSDQKVTLASSLIVGIYLTPLFCHYFFDSFLWKKNHPEASKVYGTSLES